MVGGHHLGSLGPCLAFTATLSSLSELHSQVPDTLPGCLTPTDRSSGPRAAWNHHIRVPSVSYVDRPKAIPHSVSEPCLWSPQAEHCLLPHLHPHPCPLPQTCPSDPSLASTALVFCMASCFPSYMRTMCIRPWTLFPASSLSGTGCWRLPPRPAAPPLSSHSLGASLLSFHSYEDTPSLCGECPLPRVVLPSSAQVGLCQALDHMGTGHTNTSVLAEPCWRRLPHSTGFRLCRPDTQASL